MKNNVHEEHLSLYYWFNLEYSSRQGEASFFTLAKGCCFLSLDLKRCSSFSKLPLKTCKALTL